MHIRSLPAARAALVASILVVSGACGDWTPPSPTAPTEFMQNPSSGATVSGVVNGGSVGGSTLLASTSDLTVSVVGTDISAAVSVSGKFKLTGVPAGPVMLRFTGPGIDVRLDAGPVQNQDILDLAIKIQTGDSRIESRVQIRADNTTDIEGNIVRVSGTCPNLTVEVHGWTLNLTSSTAGSCADVRVGVRIKLKGNRSGTAILVVRIEVAGTSGHDNDDDDDDRDDDDEDDDDDD